MVSFRLSASEAYARDCAGEWQPPTPLLAAAITIATRLQAAAAALPPAEQVAVVASCETEARDLVVRAGLHPQQVQDSSRDPGAATSLRVLRGQVAGAGHDTLALHLVESLMEIYSPDAVEHGRLIDMLRVLAFLRGDLEREWAHIVRLLMLGRQLRSEELLFRAWSAAGQNALQRGNLPDYARRIARCRKYAERIGDPRLIAYAHEQHAILMGLRGDHAAALVLHWRSLALTDHPTAVLVTLGNAAETLYRCGQFRAARSARARAIALCRFNDFTITVYHLGGYAGCCAALGDVDGVQWSARQVLRFPGAARDNRPFAQGLLGIADACGQVGLDALASELYALGISIADAKGFHDLRFRPRPAKQPAPRAVALPLAGEAEKALQSILDLAPDGVARDLELVAG
jgi:hypothetical protein